ncbi:hypothetical protein [Bacillus massiliigorillae]|uniref:hypothetical protein n=1 Tax=Bacillus massiliigorillae TaxID=1243664 RepID=UPI0003A0EB4E|nr:hypothetical protein [Bacillus massiliigorillae]
MKKKLIITGITEFGEIDDEAYVTIEDINSISCDDEEEYCLKILSCFNKSELKKYDFVNEFT